jgi:hypothetical protein
LSSRKESEAWLTRYYERLVEEYQFSLTRRDNITNWALTLFLAVIATYAVILTSQVVVSGFWKIALLLASLGLLVRFLSQSMIAYSFLRKWRYIENRIESHWASGQPSLEDIEVDIRKYDHGRHTPVSKWAMLWSQLRAGFLLIFIVLFGILYVELIGIPSITADYLVLFVGFVAYLIWELVIFLTYDQLRKSK